jgi:Zn-finger nucleic acid-binding protein
MTAPSARAFKCPSCGAEVAEGVRRCRHCAAPVATLRCASCFHMNSTDAAHCSGCGRELGLEPIPRDAVLECPDCRAPLTSFECGPGLLHDCATCGAQFVEHAALRDLLERHDGFELPAGPKRAASMNADTRVRYVPCPVCRAMMNRKTFAVGSGVIVDTCGKHGTWFDSGELPRVLAFVEAGGLARARRRAAEERAQESRARVSGAAAVAPASWGAARDEPALAGMSIAADLLSILFT